MKNIEKKKDLALIAEKGLAVIQDEICRCGHSKREHVGIFHHGECTHPHPSEPIQQADVEAIGVCWCQQYTWDHFVVEEAKIGEPDAD